MKAKTRREGRKHSAATIADVARRAGVSPMTVSRVVNGESSVRAATRERVNSAIAALKYMPNQAARRLAGSRLIRIAVLYSNPSAGYLNALLVGVLNGSSITHTQLVVERSETGELDVARGLVAGGIDGVILPPPLCDSQKLIDLVVKSGTPAIAVASGAPDKRICAIGIDDHGAAFQMTRHLISLGHRRIGFVKGHPNQTASARRLAGFRDAMASAGLEVPENLMAQGMFNYRSGLDAAEALLSAEPRPTAIFASNDDMAAASVAIAHRLGLDVPGDLTVAGFDDAALATTIWPELTTVHQPISDMASAAVEILVRQVRARRAGEAGAPEHVTMDFSLIRRQSDAAPRVRPPVARVKHA